MPQVTEPAGRVWTAAELAARFGPIPLDRICHEPPPGTATEDDIVRLDALHDRLYELVDGVLVEKTMGTYESYLAAVLLQGLGVFAREHKLGVVLGADGMLRLAPGLVRIPDVSFISFARWSHADVKRQAIVSLAPDLAVEVVSRGNTPQEMDEKLRDYFDAGVRLVWFIYPELQEAHVFTSPAQRTVLTETDALDGGAVLSGFRLELSELFSAPNGSEND
jgi:Uma2 family endonuclease